MPSGFDLKGVRRRRRKKRRVCKRWPSQTAGQMVCWGSGSVTGDRLCVARCKFLRPRKGTQTSSPSLAGRVLLEWSLTRHHPAAGSAQEEAAE